MAETLLINPTGEGWESLDLDCGTQIGIDRGLMDITTLNGLLSDGAQGITVPLNRNNNIAANWPARIGVCDSLATQGNFRACYQYNQITYVDGFAKITDITSLITHDCAEMKVSLIGNQGWIAELQDCKLTDIDAGSHEYTEANIVASWDRANQDTLGVAYYPVHYGDTDTGTAGDQGDEFDYTDLRPHVYFDKILEGIFANTSYSLCQTGFLESDPWRGLTWIYTGDGFGTEAEDIENVNVQAATGIINGATPNWEQPLFQQILADDDANMNLGVFTAKYLAEYTITFDFTIDISNYSSLELDFQTRLTLLKNGSTILGGGPWQPNTDFTFSSGVWTISFTDTFCLSPNETLELRFTGPQNIISIGGTNTLTITAAVGSCTGLTIDNASLLPEVSCMDFLDSIRIMFGLIFLTNEQTREVCLTPINEYFDFDNVDYWDDKVDACQLVDHRFLHGDVARCHKFVWTIDEEDGWIEELERIDNLTRGDFWSEEICLNDNYTGTQEYKPIFSPTVNYTEFSPTTYSSFPRLWTEFQLLEANTPEASYTFGYHFAYFAGTLTAANPLGRTPVWNAPDASAGLPYAYQQSFLNQDEYNLAFNDAGSNFPGLVSTYFSDITQGLTSGRIVEVKGWLNKLEYLSLDFSVPKRINLNDFLLLEVQGWNPKDGECTLVLLHLGC